MAGGRPSNIELKKMLQEKIIHEFDGNEKQFEEYVKTCLPEIFENMNLPAVKNIYRQHFLKVDGMQVKIDILVLHEDESLTVIEIKCPNTKHPSTAASAQCGAIGQLVLYQSFVNAVYGRIPRLILVDNKIHLRTVLAFTETKLPITLMEIQKDRVFIPYSNLSFGGENSVRTGNKS